MARRSGMKCRVVLPARPRRYPLEGPLLPRQPFGLHEQGPLGLPELLALWTRLASLFDNLDKVFLAEPWADRDIPRAHILKDVDQAPGARFAIACVPGDGDLTDPTRWSVLPPATAGNISVRVVAIALGRDDDRVLVQEGYSEFFTRVRSKLKHVGAYKKRTP